MRRVFSPPKMPLIPEFLLSIIVDFFKEFRRGGVRNFVVSGEFIFNHRSEKTKKYRKVYI